MAEWNARQDLIDTLTQAYSDWNDLLPDNWRNPSPSYEEFAADALVEWLRKNNEAIAEEALVSGMGILDIADQLGSEW